MNKEFTSLLLKVKVDGGQELLNEAQRVIMTISSDHYTRDFEDDLIIIDDYVTLKLSQGMTGRFGAGTLKIEITLAFENGAVMKTQTLETTLERALRRCVA